MTNFQHQKITQTAGRPLWQDSFSQIALWGLGLEFLLPFFCSLLWKIRYPKLLLARTAGLNVLFLLTLSPFLLGFFGMAAKIFRKARTALLFERLARPMAVLGISAFLFCCLFPPYCSQTGRQENYLLMDKIDDEIKREILEIFPKGLPPSADGIRYQYYKYESLMEQSLQLSLGMSLPEKEFHQEAARLEGLPILRRAEKMEDKGILLLKEKTGGGLEIHTTIDSPSRRVIVSVSFRKIRKRPPFNRFFAELLNPVYQIV